MSRISGRIDSWFWLPSCYRCLIGNVNLDISRYVSTAVAETEIDLSESHEELVNIEAAIKKAAACHNEFLKALCLPLLPTGETQSPHN